ncbi:DUF4012 domain-containing protein [Pseudarthrobacter sp. W1I19]|uniref:DUF4012 domain-containing protein n=1 Tax=Pseudarthrobacter sp. W1I19 TaxID=3042288 RepID=UPI0027D8E371|nr:DUF4012 domain-containing protein [Pseudarthrobacter sp. W1I19]
MAQSAAGPLLGIYQTLDWQSLAPGPEGIDLAPLVVAQPILAEASQAIGAASDRLDQIDAAALIPQLSGPVVAARDEVRVLKESLRTAADVALVAPAMAGGQNPRSYLLLVQNNAEARATGGIPGFLAILDVYKGKLTLGAQRSTSAVGVMSPVIPVDPEQQEIYSGRLGKFIQSVNLTPDFPTAAATAQAMWERESGQHVEGVISLDPVALSYILGATGPVRISDPDLQVLSGSGLPTELNAGNVVQTLLSDTYTKIGNPELQDAYFAGVARETFLALSSTGTDSKKLLDALARGTNEGRLLVQSNFMQEQQTLLKYRLSGSATGPGIGPGQFGAYFNDATGAKMDYYVKRTVQLIPACPAESGQMTLRVTSTNTAPADAATSLPSYVTGAGVYGVSPGSVQTNIVAYGPPHSQTGNVTVNGAETTAAAYIHGRRPVQTVGMTLVPGQSGTVDFTFENINQDIAASLAVTPGVQDVSDVIQPAQAVTCSS